MNRIDVTRDQLDQRVDVFRSYGLDPLLKVIDVPVKGVDVELNGGELVNA